MQTVEKNIKVFIAKNGKEFLSEQECSNYEKNVLSRIDKVKYYIVYHGADFTEGRGFQSHSYVAVESDWSHHEIVSMYCQIKFGRKVDWMYSVPAQVWDLKEINNIEYQNGKPKHGKTAFLSHSELEGFSSPIGLTDKTKKEDL